MRHIYILTGEGTSRFSAEYLKFSLSSALQSHGFRTVPVRAADLACPANDLLNNPQDILVFGGGSFGAVKDILGEDGMSRIRRFVEQGGTYIGLCMGSYAAARFIDFRGHGISKSTQGLGFFNDIVRGSLPITPALFDGTSRSATIAQITHRATGIAFPALYWGGNAFDLAPGHSANITPLSGMIMPDGSHKTMSVHARVGNEGGQALLCGYHAEAMSHQSIWQWVGRFSASRDDMQRMEIELKQHPNNAYQMGLACLLDDAALVPGHSFIRQVWDQTPQAPQSGRAGAAALHERLLAHPCK